MVLLRLPKGKSLRYRLREGVTKNGRGGLAALIGIDGGGGVDFGGDAWRGPNDGMGLVLVLGARAGLWVRICRCGSKLGYCLQDVCGVRSRASEILTYHGLELFQSRQLDVQLPIEVLAHLPLHLVDLSQLEHALPDDAPGLVRIGVIAYDLRNDHEGRYE